MSYLGRIAPTPTGYLHLGHACTFKIAQIRARNAGGQLIFRMEDVDVNRCKQEYMEASIEDLNRVGIEWDFGPNNGGPHEPYYQSQRKAYYKTLLDRLIELKLAYPCTLSRKQLQELDVDRDAEGEFLINRQYSQKYFDPAKTANWRFSVPYGLRMEFIDQCLGEQRAIAGESFGDFIIWNRDDIPAYELAVVADDIDMGITEVVRGEDLLKSTFRQLCIYNAIKQKSPSFYHCPLVLDENGNKLAKRSASQAIRGNEGYVMNELKRITA